MTSISEAVINERRNWKAQTFPYDHYISDDDDSECLYCLTEKQAEILRGIIQPLAWKTRWYSLIDTYIDDDKIEEFRDDIVRRLMMSCCDNPPDQFKYIGTVLYRSTNGGLTFEPAQEYDYRNTSILWPTPEELGLESSKCQAADSVVVTFKEMITEQIANDMAVTAIIGVIVTVLLTFLSAGSYALIAAQVAGIASGIFGAGVATWKAAFTSDVWEKFRCIVYCHMTDDASIDAAGIEAIRSDIASKFTGIVVPTLQGYVAAAGLIGLENMMRSNTGDSAANCDDCDCDTGCETEWLISIPNPGDVLGEITYQDNDLILANTTNINTNGKYYIYMDTRNMADCCFVSYEVLTGSPGATWKLCNSNAESTGILNPGQCIWTLILIGNEPFSVSISKADCQ